MANLGVSRGLQGPAGGLKVLWDSTKAELRLWTFQIWSTRAMTVVNYPISLAMAFAMIPSTIGNAILIMETAAEEIRSKQTVSFVFARRLLTTSTWPCSQMWHWHNKEALAGSNNHSDVVVYSIQWRHLQGCLEFLELLRMIFSVCDFSCICMCS